MPALALLYLAGRSDQHAMHNMPICIKANNGRAPIPPLSRASAAVRPGLVFGETWNAHAGSLSGLAPGPAGA